MPFFRSLSQEPIEPSLRPTKTLTGKQVLKSEEIGSFVRRARMFGSATRLLENHPLTLPNSIGIPVGAGYGLENLVAIINPLFTKEKALIRWTALRGALLGLSILCPTEDAWDQLAVIMGLDIRWDEESRQKRAIISAKHVDLPPPIEKEILGIFYSATVHWSQYSKIEEMSVDEINSAPEFRFINDSLALELIAWSSVAILRTDWIRDSILNDWPEPGLLEKPGWYAEPIFSKCERFWDGLDWTPRCRDWEGKRLIDFNMEMR